MVSSTVIGLEFTDGRVFYCPRSTLVNAGGYFAACFGDNGIPSVAERTDEHGRSIYFIAQDGKLFENHILPFILSGDPNLPSFSEDPKLWRRLRHEATLYALDNLVEILRITHSCPYSVGEDRGVLHWLGTNKGTREYQNPHASGAVAVHVGRLGDMTFTEKAAIGNNVLRPEAFTQESRQAFVQYTPPIIGYMEESKNFSIRAQEKCRSLWCNLSRHRIPSIVDLQKITLCLSAYSLRYDECGMTDWNLEGSEDCSQWTVLHRARNDQHIAKIDSSLISLWREELSSCESDDLAVKISKEFVERERRHTWQISPPIETFFRYFRIIGLGPDYQHGENASTCLHGVGLELYGDVHED